MARDRDADWVHWSSALLMRLKHASNRWPRKKHQPMKIAFMSLLVISREMFALKFSSQPHSNELVNRPRNEIISQQARIAICENRIQLHSFGSITLATKKIIKLVNWSTFYFNYKQCFWSRHSFARTLCGAPAFFCVNQKFGISEMFMNGNYRTA